MTASKAILQLVLFFSIKVLYCAEYYVKPDSSSTCPTDVEPCLTLSEYVQNSTMYFTSGSTFTLLQGQHHLNETLTLSGVTEITFRGQDVETTMILIFENSSIYGVNSQEVMIRSLEIRYHGALRLYVPMFTFSVIIALEFEDSSLQASNVKLTGNRTPMYAQGINLVQSTASFVNCSFMNWNGAYGGAVYTDKSSITFTGTNTFSNNTALSGAGIYAENNSTVEFRGTNKFLENKANKLLNVSTGQYSFWCNGMTSSIHVESSTLNVFNTALFSENFGAICGQDSNILMDGCITFSNNHNYSTLMYDSDLHCIGEIAFINNTQEEYTSTVEAYNSTLLFAGEINFMNNIAYNGAGGAMAAKDSMICLQGNISFVNNSARNGVGGGIYIPDSTLKLSGNVTFAKNQAHQGGGVYAINSIINITGSCSFLKNMATDRGGMALDVTSFGTRRNTEVILHSSVTMNFDSNRAISKGGGIIYINSKTECSESLDDNCLFTIESESLFAVIDFNFTQNYAGQGTVVYGGSITCYKISENTLVLNTPSIEISNNIDETVSNFSSDPTKVCFCDDNTPDCDEDNIMTISISRGQYFNLSVAAVGLGEIPVPSTIQAYIKQNEIATYRLNPQSHKIEAKCTNITFQLFTNERNTTLILYPDVPCGNTDFSQARSHVTLVPCPPAFTLTGTRCTCEERLLQIEQIIRCNNDTLTIERMENSWINAIWEENHSTILNFVYHPECPLNHCKPKNKMVLLLFSPNDSNILCSSNRSGTLCGACREGYSLTLNSFNCKKCDNRYLSLLMFFAFAGVALIVVLLVLHMTVAAGTINGLILYANIVNVNRIIFFPPHSSNKFTTFLTVFISWLNLDFGIETCFYNGFNAYAYAWLEYVFPLYLWFLIGAIIISSRISAKVGKLFGSNPVAVLATVILMSYSKLFQAALVSLTPTFLEYSDGHREKVWLYEGNISYFGNQHFILGLAAIFTVVFLLLPYTILLLFSYRLQAFSNKRAFSWLNKIKPLLDAYYAPYRAKTRYWPGFMLLVRGCLYTAFSVTSFSNAGANLVTVSYVFTAVALIPWLGQRVYEKLYNDILEASFILNICLLSTATYYVKYANSSETKDVNQEIATSLSISIAFLQFLGIVCFHLYLRLKDIKVLALFRSFLLKKSLLHSKGNDDELPSTVKEVSMTVMDLREPLLEDNTSQ